MTWILGLIYGLIALWASSMAAAVFGTLGVLPFVVVPRGRRERYAIVAAGWWCDLVVRGFLLARPVVTGTVDLSRSGGRGAMFVSNHRSWIDPLLMVRWTHSQGLSKALIRYIPFVGFFAYLTGAVFFDRGNPKDRKRAREEMMWLLQQGARCHMFPEGTRSRDGNVRDKVHLVLPRDCWEARIPVVPCAVWGTERVLPVVFPSAFPFQACRFDIGEPMYPEDYPDADAFAKACWEEVLHRIEGLKAEERANASSRT